MGITAALSFPSWLIFFFPKLILSFVQSSRYFYEKRFNNFVEVVCRLTCVVELSEWAIALFPDGMRFGE